MTQQQQEAHTMATVASDAQGLDALLLCPFCGSEAGLEEAYHDCPWYWVECTNEDCKGGSYSIDTCKEDAIAMWNRRTPPATLSPTLSAQSVATIRQALKHYRVGWEVITVDYEERTNALRDADAALAELDAHRTSAQGEG